MDIVVLLRVCGSSTLVRLCLYFLVKRYDGQMKYSIYYTEVVLVFVLFVVLPMWIRVEYSLIYNIGIMLQCLCNLGHRYAGSPSKQSGYHISPVRCRGGTV